MPPPVSLLIIGRGADNGEAFDGLLVLSIHFLFNCFVLLGRLGPRDSVSGWLLLL